MKEAIGKYYEGSFVCDDMSCSLATRQLSVCGACCLARGCRGKMRPMYGERELWNQLQYFSSLMDVEHRCKDIAGVTAVVDTASSAAAGASDVGVKDLAGILNKTDKSLFGYLKESIDEHISNSAYNFVRPSLFKMFFAQ